MRRFALHSAVALVVLSIGSPALCEESIRGREILGLRIGGIKSTSGLDEAFGSGSNLEIYFYHGLTGRLALGVSLSGHNFGKSQLPDKDLEFLGIPRTIDFMIYSVTGCVMMKKDLSKKFRFSGELGGGLYTSNADIPFGGFYEGRISHNRLGVNAGAELWWRLARRGIYLGLGGKWHYVFSGTDFDQVIYTYTGEDYAHYFQVTLGISFLTDN